MTLFRFFGLYPVEGMLGEVGSALFLKGQDYLMRVDQLTR